MGTFQAIPITLLVYFSFNQNKADKANTVKKLVGYPSFLLD
jgi:hypothetical protein